MTARSEDPPISVYWSSRLVDAWCDEESNGCFFPGTQVAVATSDSLGHEVVHAVLDSDSDAFFVEEGLAEYLSGVGASVRGTGDLEELLDLSRRDYQSGRLSYRRATHFLAFVHDELGDNAVNRLASALRRREGRGGLRTVLEDVFGEPIDEVAKRWREAPRRYSGLSRDQVVTVPPEGDTSWWRWTLDCSDSETYGPLDEDRPEMFRVGKFEILESGWMEVGVFGDAPATVTIFDPYAEDQERRAIDWAHPDPSVDPDAITLEGPTQQWVWVEPGTKILMASTEEMDRVMTVRLELTLP